MMASEISRVRNTPATVGDDGREDLSRVIPDDTSHVEGDAILQNLNNRNIQRLHITCEGGYTERSEQQS